MSLSQGDGAIAPTNPTADETHSESSTSTVRAEDDSNPAPKANPNLCGICKKEVGKYKCPQCVMPYCSVACNRMHKENHPPPSETTKPPQPPPPVAEDINDPFRVLLDNTSEFKRLLRKYPFLHEDLNKILQSTLPPESSTDGPNNGSRFPTLFKQQNGRGQQPWSRETGLRNGAAALRQARTDPTERGDAVRELCDLILYLLHSRNNNASNSAGVPSRDLTEVVREEVVEEETKIIERLLQEESRGDRDK